MAATKVHRLLPFKDFTHSLSIQFAKSSFLPQLETSVQRFRKDALGKIPEKAFLPPELMDFYIGKLKLETALRREAFSKVLHSLDYSKLIRPGSKSEQVSSAATKQVDPASPFSCAAPFTVNISGLVTTSPHPSNATILKLPAVDPTGRLQPFVCSLIDCFTAAGFPILNPQPHPTCQLVNCFLIQWGRPKPDVILPNGKRRDKKESRVPRFDAREMLKMYENVIWAKDVRLERVSLDGIGRSGRNPDGDKIFKQPPEIDSVALP